MNIHLTKFIPTDTELLLTTLLAHEQLCRFFNATFVVEQAENSGEIAGGAGCLRNVTTRGNSFIEKITSADEQGIQYQIVGKGPLKNHQGDILFNSTGGGTLVNYHIRGEVDGWLPDFLVKMVIKRDIAQALEKLAIHFNKAK